MSPSYPARMPRYPYPEVGARIAALREQKGWTQLQMAQKMGKHRSHLAAWEQGQGMTLANRALLAKTLGVDATTLGPAYDPEAPRPQYRRGRRPVDTDSGRNRALVENPDHVGVTSASPYTPERMVDVASYPDPDLLDRFLGLWRALPSAESRQRVFDCAIGELQHGAPPRSAVPKVRAPAV